MSVEIIEHPVEISFVKNPINYSLQTNKLYDTPFVFPFITFTFTDLVEVDKYMVFSFIDPISKLSINVQFDYVLNPDGKGSELKSEVPGGPNPTLANWVIDVLAEMQKNPILKTHYTLNLDSPTVITATAKEAIADLVPTGYADNSGRVSEIISTDFLKPDRNNIFILAELYKQDFNDPDVFEKIMSASAAPDDAGKLEIDVSAALHAELTNSFLEPPLPADINAGLPIEENITLTYYIRVAEATDGKNSEWKYDCLRLAHCGGVSVEDFPKIDPFSFISLKSKFLTWSPNFKTLHVDQPDWLTWINYTNKLDDFKVVHKAYYKDGTTSADQLSAVTNLDRWQRMVLPIGYTQLNIAAINPAKEVFKWEVWIINANLDIVSEIKTFLLDCRVHECGRLIVYLNSFCSPESLLTRGEWITNLKIERSFSDRILNKGYQIVNGQEYQFDQNSRNNFEARSGFMRQVDAIALQDLLIESNSFLIEDNEYIPVFIDQGSYKITECRQFLHSLSFTLQKSILKNKLSDLKRKPLIDVVFNCGMTAFIVDENKTKVTAMGSLKVFDSSGNLIITVVSPFPTLQWDIVPKITQEDVYRVTAQLTLDTGEILDYDFNVTLRNKHITWKTDDFGSHLFVISSNVVQDSWVDFKAGNNETLEPLAIGANVISDTLFSVFTISIDYNLPCPEEISLFTLASQVVTEIDISELRNVATLSLFGNMITGELDISEFIKLEVVSFAGNSLDNVIVGYHPALESIDISSNNISNDNLDTIILDLWNFRNRYTFSGTVLNVSGNPDLPLSAFALDILNGTGEFVGEGLVADFGWILIT